jgi:DNA-binding transcriptional regulator YiaG
MNDEHWATVIKVAAVAVAAPRWIGALLEAEGVPLPAEWRGWWVVFSAVCAAGMALVEAGAFAFCLRAWRGMTGRSANVMALLIGASAVTFVVVLSPYIAANVSKVSMSKLLVDGWLLAWSVAVALSTILIIASVGYAQKRPVARTPDTTGRTTVTTGATGNANETRTDANTTRTVTREEFITAWRANGHTSIAALAQELGVNARTAQKWIQKADEAPRS